MQPHSTTPGLTHFGIIWLGQLVSLIGSALTTFALGVWTYQQTGATTRFALLSLCAVLPGILLAPLAGALVDRWSRRAVMLTCDLIAGLSTLTMAALLLSGHSTWQLGLLMAVSATAGAFHWPAYVASIPLLVPEQHLGRAAGLAQIGHAASLIVAPLLVGPLLPLIGLRGVLLLDLATCLLAVISLSLVRIPRPPHAAESGGAPPNLIAEARAGWAYIMNRPGLPALLALFGLYNLLSGLIDVLVTPLVFAAVTPIEAGVALGVSGTGMLAGTLVLGVWGGPRRRVRGILAAMAVSGGCLMLMAARPSAWPLALGGWGFLCCVPLINGCYQALLQSSVPLAMQGRVFAISRMVSESTLPLAYLAAGPLADRIAEPLLARGGGLSGSVGLLIGVGPGRGIALVFLAAGAFILVVALVSAHFAPLAAVEADSLGPPPLAGGPWYYPPASGRYTEEEEPAGLRP